MTRKFDDNAAAALREDARTEQHANSGEPYPHDTVVIRPNAPSRMFNLRLSEGQFGALQQRRAG